MIGVQKPVHLRVLDNRGSADRSLANLRALNADPKVVAIVGGVLTASLIQSLPEIRKPVFVPVDGAMPDSSSLPLFRLAFANSDELGLVLKDLQGHNFKKIAFVFANNFMGRQCQESFLLAMPSAYGIELVATYWVNVVGSNYDAMVSEIGQLQAQSVIWCSSESMLKDFYQALFRTPKVQTIRIYGVNEFEGGILNSMALNQNYPVFSMKLVDQGQFGQAERSYWVARDLFDMMAKAINASPSMEPDMIASTMRALDFHAGLLQDYRKPFSESGRFVLDSRLLDLRKIGALQ